MASEQEGEKIPPQHQERQPGLESAMSPRPEARPRYPGCGKLAPSYVFLASDDASYMTGQVLHPNGGEVVGG